MAGAGVTASPPLAQTLFTARPRTDNVAVVLLPPFPAVTGPALQRNLTKLTFIIFHPMRFVELRRVRDIHRGIRFSAFGEKKTAAITCSSLPPLRVTLHGGSG